MISNDREVDLVNEVAEKEGYSEEEIQDVWETIKQSLIDALEVVKVVINDVLECIREKNEPNERTWHVPIKIEAPPMPDIAMPRMMNIRSEL